MGWICIPAEAANGACELLGGSTVRFYSIADDVALIHDRLFEFISAITPGMYGLLIVTLLCVMSILMFLSVKAAIDRIGGI